MDNVNVDVHGWSDLQHLVYNNDLVALDTRLSLLSERSVNHQNNYGYTALMMAADQDNVEWLDLLLKNGADVNLVDKFQQTALVVSACCGHEKCVDRLLSISNINISCNAWRLSYLGGHFKCAHKILKKKLERELEMFYFPFTRTKLRVEEFLEELMQKVWHPDSLMFAYFLAYDDT